ncbi:MAG: hypothetical protein IJ679_01325 [Lachnospiraceae bacterium]|nr:hypothetical protein [Lachnospiraceae bacterium]
MEKRGWKLPFMAGLVMVALGTFLSAFSPNLLVFVLARAVVGLGYLAELFGFQFVFIVSAILTLLTSACIIGMENALLPKNKKDTSRHPGKAGAKNAGSWITVLLFVMLMIAPFNAALLLRREKRTVSRTSDREVGKG